MVNWHPLGTIWHPFEGSGIRKITPPPVHYGPPSPSRWYDPQPQKNVELQNLGFFRRWVDGLALKTHSPIKLDQKSMVVWATHFIAKNMNDISQKIGNHFPQRWPGSKNIQNVLKKHLVSTTMVSNLPRRPCRIQAHDPRIFLSVPLGNPFRGSVPDMVKSLSWRCADRILRGKSTGKKWHRCLLCSSYCWWKKSCTRDV